MAISLQPAARAWLAVQGYDETYGARPLARVVQTEVRNPLTDEILFGRLQHGGTVRIGPRKDALTFRYEAAAGAGEGNGRRLTGPSLISGSRSTARQTSLASRALTSRFRLTPSSAARIARARCVSGGTRTMNRPL